MSNCRPHTFLPFTFNASEDGENRVTQWFYDVVFDDDFGPVPDGTHFDAALVSISVHSRACEGVVTLLNAASKSGTSTEWDRIHDVLFRGDVVVVYHEVSSVTADEEV